MGERGRRGWSTRRRGAVLGVLLAGMLMGTGLPGAARAGAADEQPKATDVGITDKEIRIGVIADVDTPLAPGAYKGARDAVLGWGEYINRNGGLAGRKVVVDFYDSKLSADETRNALIEACQKDFAIVGTGALFLNNVDDMVACPDAQGRATGLPDFPVISLWEAHQASPVSFPITAPAKDFSDPSGETYRARVGRFRWYQKNVDKNLHGVFVVGADLAALRTATMPIWIGAQKTGIESDGVFDAHATDSQDKFLPIASSIQSSGATIVSTGINDTLQAYLLKEAGVQGVSSVKVWDCTNACYSKKYLDTAGPRAEGEYVDMPFVPVEEAKANPAVKSYVKSVGAENVDGNGVQAWAAALLFRDVVNAVVEQGGINALTRSNVLDAARDVHSFDADGMIGEADIAGKVPSPCYSLFQVKGGKFVRVYPKKAATFDCNPDGVVTVKQSS